jgi:hypothetical protein
MTDRGYKKNSRECQFYQNQAENNTKYLCKSKRQLSDGIMYIFFCLPMENKTYEDAVTGYYSLSEKNTCFAKKWSNDGFKATCQKEDDTEYIYSRRKRIFRFSRLTNFSPPHFQNLNYSPG